MDKESEVFKAWFKKEYLGIDALANQGDEGAITRRDYAYVGWQAAKAQAEPEGYRLVPVELNNEIESAMFSSVARGEMPCDIYKAMIGAQESKG